MTALQGRVYVATQMMSAVLLDKLPEVRNQLDKAPLAARVVLRGVLDNLPRLLPTLAAKYHEALSTTPDEQIRASVGTILQALSSILDEPEAAQDTPASVVEAVDHGSSSPALRSGPSTSATDTSANFAA